MGLVVAFTESIWTHACITEDGDAGTLARGGSIARHTALDANHGISRQNLHAEGRTLMDPPIECAAWQ